MLHEKYIALLLGPLTVIIFLAFIAQKSKKAISDIPLHQFPDGQDTHDSYVKLTRQLHYDGYKKYTKADRAYRVRTSAGGERIILPLRYVTEIKNAPQSAISLPEEMSHLLLMSYTGVPQRTDSGTKVVRVDMTRQLGNLVSAMNEECVDGFQRYMPECRDWVPVTIYPVLARIVAQISGRVLVGTELCRNEEWMRLSIEFSTHAFGAARTLRASNRYFWSMLWSSYTSPAIARIRQGKHRATALLQPICEQRLASMASPTWKAPKDGNQWLLESHSHSGENIDEVVKSQLRLTMAAIHNTTMAVTNDLFDLIAHPEYIDSLREEVSSVLAQEGGWTKQALTKMRKLDSFMKESQRMNPSTMLTLKRKVLRDYRLHDGLLVPKGSHVAFASDGVNRDPDIYADPDSFNGLRFHNLRSTAADSDGADGTAMQFVTATSSYLSWGAGRSACPGRFFASNEIKLMMAYILQHYEFSWREGEGRPESAVNDWNILPDREKVIMVRKK